ncbi:MAG: radical SAM protein [Thermofilum sp.]
MTAVTLPAHTETGLLPVIAHRGKPGGEVRPLFFLRAFGMEALPARLISFGSCNFSCPYCKRTTAIARETVHVSLDELRAVIETARKGGEIIRFSGGDPSVFPRETLLLALHAGKLGVPVTSSPH